jgi:hypothetical protein
MGRAGSRVLEVKYRQYNKNGVFAFLRAKDSEEEKG